MDNALDPNLMTASERLTEIGEILAAALLQLRARQSRQVSDDHGDSYLDFSAHQSVHGRKR